MPPGRRPTATLQRTARFLLRWIRHPSDGRAWGHLLRRSLPPREVKRLTQVLLELEPGLEMTFDRHGVRWTADMGTNAVGWSLFQHGDFNQAAVDRLLTRIGPGVIVDVGANLGTASIPFALAGRDVVAIEPVPATFGMLTRNVVANGLEESIRCVNAAIADTAGEVLMEFGAGGSARSEVLAGDPHLSEESGGSLVGVASVDAAPLSEILRRVGVTASDVALVWSDAQGSEAAVVRSAGALWTAGVPAYLEIEPVLLERHGGAGGFLAAVSEAFTSVELEDDGTLLPVHELGAAIARRGPTWRGTNALFSP